MRAGIELMTKDISMAARVCPPAPAMPVGTPTKVACNKLEPVTFRRHLSDRKLHVRHPSRLRQRRAERRGHPSAPAR